MPALGMTAAKAGRLRELGRELITAFQIWGCSMRTMRAVGVVAVSVLISTWAMAPGLAADPVGGPMEFVLEEVDGSEFHFRGEKGVAWITTSFGCGGRCRFDLTRRSIGNDGAIEKGSSGLTFEYQHGTKMLRITAAKLSCEISHSMLDLRMKVSAAAGDESVIEVPAKSGLAFACTDVTAAKTPDASVPK